MLRQSSPTHSLNVPGGGALERDSSGPRPSCSMRSPQRGATGPYAPTLPGTETEEGGGEGERGGEEKHEKVVSAMKALQRQRGT